MTTFVLSGAYTSALPVNTMDDKQLITYIRVSFSLPILISLFQMFMLSVVFPYDTPTMLIK